MIVIAIHIQTTETRLGIYENGNWMKTQNKKNMDAVFRTFSKQTWAA